MNRGSLAAILKKQAQEGAKREASGAECLVDPLHPHGLLASEVFESPKWV